MNPSFAEDKAASVRQRLLNPAGRDLRPFNELLQYYAGERFLYRLCRSAQAERFILRRPRNRLCWTFNTSAFRQHTEKSYRRCFRPGQRPTADQPRTRET